MFPGGAAREAKVALSRTAADEMPRQFGPRSRAPCARIDASNDCWRSSPSEPTSAKPAEITQTARTPVSRTRIHRLEDRGRRETDDRELDGIGDVRDGAVSPDACDRLAVAIHGVCGTHVLALEDVAEELASDRAPARRGAEHRDGLRLEERTERRDDRGVITFLDERCIPDGGGDRERHLDLTAGKSSRHFEAHAFEDFDHRSVVRHHLADETFDSARGSARGELFDQPRPDAAPLVGIRNGESHFRGQRIAKANVVGECDDSFLTCFDH